MALKKTRYGMPVETAERETYNDRARGRLQEWNEKLQSMKAAARANDTDGFVFYRELHRMMQRRIKVADATLQKLDLANGNTWSDVRARMEYAWEELENQYARWNVSVFSR